MADPKIGYKPGVKKVCYGAVDANGYFSVNNEPKEGFLPGIYKITEVAVDGSGNLTPSTEDQGVSKTVQVTVGDSGDTFEDDSQDEGYERGVYRVTTDTDVPKEGVILTFASDDITVNNITSPSDFSSWTVLGAGVVSTNTTISPDGTQNADTLTDNSAGTTEGVRDNDRETAANNDYCIHSVYVKKDSTGAATRYVQIRTRWAGGGTTGVDAINLDTATGDHAVISVSGGTTTISSRVDAVGDYWRIEHITRNDATGNTWVEMYLYPAANSGTLSTTGFDATLTGSCIVWNARRVISSTI